MSGLLGGLPIVGGLLGGGDSGGGGLLGGGGIGGMLGGLPIVGGLFGGGGGGSSGGGTYHAPTGYPTQSYGGGPWPSFPGMPNGNPQPQKFTGDFSGPGPAENFFAQNQGKWGPGQTEGQAWWDANKGKFGAGIADQYWNGLQGNKNPPTTSNNAQGAYNEFTAGTPQDMSSYYDTAVRKAGEGIERAFGARGMRGSSAELDQLAESGGNLRAQEARDNANYGLQRAGLAGNLASGADTSSGRDITNRLSWMTGLGGLGLGTQNSDLNRLLGAAGIATGLDTSGLNWLNSGMNAALGAQGAMRGRGQDFFNNNLNATTAEMGPMFQAYMSMLGNDQALQQAAIDASTGWAREGANQSTQGRAASEQGIGNLFGLMGGMIGMGGVNNLGNNFMNGKPRGT